MSLDNLEYFLRKIVAVINSMLIIARMGIIEIHCGWKEINERLNDVVEPFEIEPPART